MLILILIDAQYLQKVVFIFEKGSNGQNYYSLIPPNKISNFSHPLMLFGKPCHLLSDATRDSNTYVKQKPLDATKRFQKVLKLAFFKNLNL